LRLFCWITTLVVLFLVRYVLEFRCGWVGVVSVLQAEAQLSLGCNVAGRSFSLQQAPACHTDTSPTQPHRNSNTHRTKNNTTNVVIQQNSLKLLMLDTSMPETYWAHKKWNKIASGIKLVFFSSPITMMHGPINIRYILHVAVFVTQSSGRTLCYLLNNNMPLIMLLHRFRNKIYIIPHVSNLQCGNKHCKLWTLQAACSSWVRNAMVFLKTV